MEKGKESGHPRTKNSLSVIVRDLSYFCTEQDLQKLINAMFPKLEGFTIYLPKSKETPPRPLLYGFVQLENEEQVIEVVQQLDGMAFMGRKLKAQSCSGRTIGYSASKNYEPGTQIHYKFESLASHKEQQPVADEDRIRQHFQQRGTVVDVTIKKYSMEPDHSHTGYGFIIFSSFQEATAAARELNDTQDEFFHYNCELARTGQGHELSRSHSQASLHSSATTEATTSPVPFPSPSSRSEIAGNNNNNNRKNNWSSQDNDHHHKLGKERPGNQTTITTTANTAVNSTASEVVLPIEQPLAPQVTLPQVPGNNVPQAADRHNNHEQQQPLPPPRIFQVGQSQRPHQSANHYYSMAVPVGFGHPFPANIAAVPPRYTPAGGYWHHGNGGGQPAPAGPVFYYNPQQQQQQPQGQHFMQVHPPQPFYPAAGYGQTQANQPQPPYYHHYQHHHHPR